MRPHRVCLRLERMPPDQSHILPQQSTCSSAICVKFIFFSLRTPPPRAHVERVTRSRLQHYNRAPPRLHSHALPRNVAYDLTDRCACSELKSSLGSTTRKTIGLCKGNVLAAVQRGRIPPTAVQQFTSAILLNQGATHTNSSASVQSVSTGNVVS